MNETEPKPRLARFSIGRLFNLGNYEHVRYELTVEVPPECSAKEAFQNALLLLRAASPHGPCTKSELESARSTLAKPAEELGHYERAQLDVYKSRVADYEIYTHNRALALEALDKLGGKVEYKDCRAAFEPEDY